MDGWSGPAPRVHDDVVIAAQRMPWPGVGCKTLQMPRGFRRLQWPCTAIDHARPQLSPSRGIEAAVQGHCKRRFFSRGAGPRGRHGRLGPSSCWELAVSEDPWPWRTHGPDCGSGRSPDVTSREGTESPPAHRHFLQTGSDSAPTPPRSMPQPPAAQGATQLPQKVTASGHRNEPLPT